MEKRRQKKTWFIFWNNSIWRDFLSPQGGGCRNVAFLGVENTWGKEIPPSSLGIPPALGWNSAFLTPRISANRRIQAWNLILTPKSIGENNLGKLELPPEGAPGVFRSKFHELKSDFEAPKVNLTPWRWKNRREPCT